MQCTCQARELAQLRRTLEAGGIAAEQEATARRKAAEEREAEAARAAAAAAPQMRKTGKMRRVIKVTEW